MPPSHADEPANHRFTPVRSLKQINSRKYIRLLLDCIFCVIYRYLLADFSTSLASSSLSDLTFSYLALLQVVLSLPHLQPELIILIAAHYLLYAKSSDISGSTQPDIGICDTWLAAAAPEPSGFIPLICCRVFLPSSSVLSLSAVPPKPKQAPMPHQSPVSALFPLHPLM